MRFIIIASLLCFSICRPVAASLIEGSTGSIMKARIITKFLEPWAMTFINDKEMIVTSKRGKLWLVSTSGKKTEILGVPKVAFGGQGGLGDVVLHPNFIENRMIYLSYIRVDEKNPMLRGAVVFLCKLETSLVLRCD